MPQYTHKTGEPWTAVDFEQIRHMVADNMPIRTICLRLGRTQAAVYRKASQMGISLRPPENSMRGRRCSEQELRRNACPAGAPNISLVDLLLQMNNLETSGGDKTTRQPNRGGRSEASHD